MKKKLVILADCSIHTNVWIEILKDLFEIHLISFSKNTINGINFYPINAGDINQKGGNYKYLLHINQIRKLIKTIKPDLINAHYLTSYGLIASILKGKVPLIMSLHGTDILVTAKKNIIFKIAAKYSLSKSNHIFSVSDFMTKELKKYIKPDTPVTTIQYGVNIDKIHENHNKEKIYDFISTRNIIKNSNMDIIINAFEKYVQSVDSNSKLVILATGNLFKYYKDVIKQKELENNIIMPGKVDNNLLIDYLNQAKFFISLTSSDGTPLSLLEAMAAGSVPIVSNIPANQEWITNGVNGFISDISVDSLYQIMLELQSADCLSITKCAFNTVAERGNREKNSIIIRNIFENIILSQSIKGKKII